MRTGDREEPQKLEFKTTVFKALLLEPIADLNLCRGFKTLDLKLNYRVYRDEPVDFEVECAANPVFTVALLDPAPGILRFGEQPSRTEQSPLMSVVTVKAIVFGVETVTNFAVTYSDVRSEAHVLQCDDVEFTTSSTVEGIPLRVPNYSPRSDQVSIIAERGDSVSAHVEKNGTITLRAAPNASGFTAVKARVARESGEMWAGAFHVAFNHEILKNKHDIEGYSDKISYRPGDQVQIKVHTLNPRFSCTVCRFGKEETLLLELRDRGRGKTIANVQAVSAAIGKIQSLSK